MEGADDALLELVEVALVAILRVEADQLRIPEGRVHAHRHVEGAQLLVDREEVRVAQEPLPLHAAQEDATGAVLLYPAQLGTGLIHVVERDATDPAEPAV